MEILFFKILSYEGVKFLLSFLKSCEFWWLYKVIVINGNFFFPDNVDASELKQFFETNYSQIYFIFYENFITLENSLKLKGKHFCNFFDIHFF